MKKTKEQLEKDRRSIAVYPTPVGEDIEHAIPVWSQPVRNENWDEVRRQYFYLLVADLLCFRLSFLS
jgi:hypothetical protein